MDVFVGFYNVTEGSCGGGSDKLDKIDILFPDFCMQLNSFMHLYVVCRMF